MYQGTIKNLTDRGFGFIAQADGGNDVFFHTSALQGVTFEELNEGDAVTFDIEETPKGLNAANVTRA